MSERDGDLRDMQTHRTTFPNRTAAVAAVVALGITASCGSDDNDDPNTGQPVETTVGDQPMSAQTNTTHPSRNAMTLR